MLVERFPSSIVTSLAAFGILCLAGLAEAAQQRAIDSNTDEVLIGRIYQKDSNLQHLLFNFRRTASRSGDEIQVTRTYTYPDGRTAAIEKAIYRDGKLSSHELEEKQIDAHGQAEVHGDAWEGGGQISFSYSKDSETHTDVEDLKAGTVVNDDIVPYTLAHWDELMQGKKVSLQFIVIPRTETVGFELVKSGETTWKGKPAVIIEMVPASFFVRLVVDPMYLTVVKNTHRVVKYEGRVTPKIKENGEWTDLDAVMVFPGNARARDPQQN